MNEKRKVTSGIKWLRQVGTWQLVVLLLISIVLSATFLRLNNIGMIERRTAVLNADQAGDEEITRDRMYALQRYVSSNMNASSGTVYLSGQYGRDTQAAIQKSQASGGENINVLADRACKTQFGGYSQAYVQCFASELAKYPPGTNDAEKAQLPSVDLYKYSFASPLWSPDFAGFSVLISGLITLVIIIRLIGLLLLRLLLRRHYQSV